MLDRLDLFLYSRHDGRYPGAEVLAEMEVFPNPTAGILNIGIPGDMNKNVNVTIYNVLGEIVYTAQQSELKTLKATNGRLQYSVDLGHLSDGSYLLKVQSGDKLFMEQVILSR